MRAHEAITDNNVHSYVRHVRVYLRADHGIGLAVSDKYVGEIIAHHVLGTPQTKCAQRILYLIDAAKGTAPITACGFAA